MDVSNTPLTARPAILLCRQIRHPYAKWPCPLSALSVDGTVAFTAKRLIYAVLAGGSGLCSEEIFDELDLSADSWLKIIDPTFDDHSDRFDAFQCRLSGVQ